MLRAQGKLAFWLGAVFVFVAALSWSTAGIFPRLVQADLPTTLFFRSLSGAISLFFINLVLSKPDSLRACVSLSKSELGYAVICTAAMCFYIAAFYYTSIANVSFMYGTMPILTLALGVLFLKHKMELREVFCCILVAIGVAMLIGGQLQTVSFIGLLLSFVMTLLFSIMTLYLKHFPNGNMLKASYMGLVALMLLLWPWVEFSQTSNRDILILSIYGLVNMGIGGACYIFGVKRISAIMAALISLVEVPLAPIWAYLLFQESIGASSLLGGLLILASVVYYLWHKSKSDSA
jgi:drug/metabolite transporter (DMT)-like permease